MRYAIIGCGTGGPAAALLLHRQGHEVVLFDRVKQLRPVGAGFLLQPTGQQVLRELGLLNRVLAHADRISRLVGTTSYGRAVIDLRYGDLRPDLHGLGVSRGAISSALQDAVAADGIPVRTGVEVGAVTERQDGVEVLGERFDRAVISDGARSHLRPPWARSVAYPWGALWYVTQAEFARDTLRQHFRDTRQFIGFLPSGDRTISIFWSLRADAADDWRSRGLDRWKAELRALAPDAPLDDLHDPDQVVFAPYFDVRMSRWHTDRVVWIGDAAHAMSPQLGQGANLALWDAWTLSQVPDFATYSRVRRAHLRFYQFATRWLTPFFQSSLPVLAPLRDLGSPVFHAWPWYYRQMLLTLAGVKTGALSAMEIP